ncbi:hypothetical protein [Sinomicrobium sp.]
MHITVDKLRNAECLPFTWGNCIVLLDGVEVKNAFEADDEAGWVKRYTEVVGKNGYPEEEVLYGHVEFDVH